jgi:hypothetical protein
MWCVTENYDIGDLIRANMGNALDAIVKAIDQAPAIDGDESVEEQVRPATDDELADIEALAMEAAEVQDEIKAAVGDKGAKLKILKAQLKDRMLQHGLKEVVIAGRPPIELEERRSRKPTRKLIIAAMQKEHGDAEGKKKALKLWNSIEYSTTQSVSIPDPTPPSEEP